MPRLSLFDHAGPEVDIGQEPNRQIRNAPIRLEREIDLDRETIGDLPISFTGTASLAARSFNVGDPVRVFEFNDAGGPQIEPPAGVPNLPGAEDLSELASPPDQHAFTELKVQLGANLAAATEALSNKALTLAFEAAAGGAINYRLLLPAPGVAHRNGATLRLLNRAASPHRVHLQDLELGEVHTLDARVLIGFEASAKAGDDLEIDRAISMFDDLSLAIQAHATATLEASLGLALYDRMQIAVGRTNVAAQRNWVRVRIQRLRRRELTLGAKLDIQVKYNFGADTFGALFDRVLEVDPTKRLFGALGELNQLNLHEVEESQAWEEIRGLITEKAQAVILDYLDLEQAVADLPFADIEPFLAAAGELVAVYNGLDTKVSSLLEGTLGRVGLEEGSAFREALQFIAGLPIEGDVGEEENELDGLLEMVLTPEHRNVVPLLELLGNASLEEITLGVGATRALARAQELAQAADQALQAIGDHALGLLAEFTRNKGVEAVITWFEENAATPEALGQAIQNGATRQIKGVVSRLIGKSADQLNEGDRERIVSWARRLSELSDDREAFSTQVTDAIARLEGEMGFLAGVEYSRLTEKAAIVDLEFDPGRERLREAVESSLASFSARSLVEDLDERDADHYRLRDSIFSRRHIRSSAFTAVLSFLGIDRNQKRTRIREEVVQLVTDGNEILRRAEYTGGGVQSLRGEDAKLAGFHELATWTTVEASGVGGGSDEPYNAIEESAFRLFCTRKDEQADHRELAGIQGLLGDLGFTERAAADAVLGDLIQAEQRVDTEFGLAIRASAPAVSALFETHEEPGWTSDYWNAAHRWFDDRLVPRPFGQWPDRPRKGQILAAALHSPEFATVWEHGFEGLGNDGAWEVAVGGQPYELDVFKINDMNHAIIVREQALNTLLARFDRSIDNLGAASQGYVQIFGAEGQQPLIEPAALRELCTEIGKLWQQTPFHRSWPSPLFNLWLVASRCARRAPETLGHFRGLAALTIRRGDETETLRWTLHGLNDGIANIFPFEER